MSQNHSVTKRNRRQVSHTRGHEGRETQLALRSPEATELGRKQEQEILTNKLKGYIEAKRRKRAKEAKHKGLA